MRRSLPIIFALIATILISVDLEAQYELGDGHRLDNNLREGSGGRNTEVNRVPPGAYNNAVITGNTGFNRFRGEIDYQSVYEFQDSLSSDELFNFRANTATNPRGSSPQLNPGGNFRPTVVLRSEVGSRTGLMRSEAGGAGGFNVVVPTTTYTPLTRAREDAFRQAQSLTSVGLEFGDGTITQNMASPLGGLIVREYGPDTRIDRSRLGRDDLRPGEIRLSPLDLRDPRQPLGGPYEEGTDESTESDDEQSDSPRSLSEALGELTLDRVQIAPTLLMGANLNRDITEGNRVRQLDAEGDGEAIDRDPELARVGTVDRLILDDVGTTRYEQGEDAYSDLMREMAESGKNRQAVDIGEQNRTGTAADGDPGDEALAAGQEPDVDETEEEPGGLVDDATGLRQRLRESERAFEERVKQAQIALGSIDYRSNPTESIAGTARTAFHRAMRDAEANMVKADYFEAERDYQRALFINPRHPFAYVGRLHAQMGAGMYRTASRNLRQILVDHVQLIRVRYATPVIPDADRMARLIEALRRQAETEQNGDAAMLMAYTAYQAGDRQALKEAMDYWQEYAPRDILYRVASKLWTLDDEPEAGQEAEQNSPADPNGQSEK